MKHIKSENLSLSDIPNENSSWEKIIKFASTFDAPNEIKSEANISSIFDIEKSNTIPEMRLALYTEWRRYNHVGDFIEKETPKKSQEVIGWLREKVKNR
ncbi:MAG: hypothetical protein OQK95_09855 [Gammaproteobacteria bacterium]|nr:hypothetical protein [Gammaproteobacteria bacterium]MCW9030787.1 hypothetical protein [Gammaproteobacteria bacterium]